MDPNANLQEQEQIIVDGIARGQREYPREQASAEAREAQAQLHELRDALSAWIKGGGFAPEWARCPNAAQYYGQGTPTTIAYESVD